MANPSKAKGDAAEREAVEVLRAFAPDLVLPKAQRLLGAGRKEDVGDLYVFDDVAVQVKNFQAEKIGQAIRQAATGATMQALNGDKRFALGMVPIPRAPKSGAVRWLACVEEWPQMDRPGHPAPEPIVDFNLVSRLVDWIRDDEGPHGYAAWDREVRLGVLLGGPRPLIVAPIEAWVAGYRVAKTGHAATPTGVASITSAKMLNSPTAPAAQSA